MKDTKYLDRRLIMCLIIFLLLLLVNGQAYAQHKNVYENINQKKTKDIELIEMREIGKYKVIIKYKSFDKSKHKLKFYKNENVVIKIDNQEYYGTDGTIPGIEISSINLIELGKEYSFPSVQYNLLFEPHLGEEYYANAFSLKEYSSHIEINLSGGDGAGSYEVNWLVFKKSKLIKRQLSDILVIDGPQKPKITISKLRRLHKQ